MLISLLAFIGTLVPLIVAIMEAVKGHRDRDRRYTNAFSKRTLDSLHAADDRMRKEATNPLP